MRRRYRQINGEIVEVYNSEEERKARNYFSSDEMEPTLHPVTGKYFTSKQKFRAETRALGMEEVGNEYANGYNPEVERKKEEVRALKRLKAQRIEMMRELLD